MPHISKKHLEEKTLKDISNEFLKTVSSPRRKYMLRDILTETEQIMLAKRLAIIVMLTNKRSFYEIQHTLKVSPMTPSRIKQNLDLGQYKHLEKALKEKRLEKTILGFLLKSYAKQMGRGQYDWIDDLV